MEVEVEERNASASADHPGEPTVFLADDELYLAWAEGQDVLWGVVAP